MPLFSVWSVGMVHVASAFAVARKRTKDAYLSTRHLSVNLKKGLESKGVSRVILNDNVLDHYFWKVHTHILNRFSIRRLKYRPEKKTRNSSFRGFQG